MKAELKAPNTITFNVNDELIMQLKPNGEIYVKGKLIENDIEVVNAIREFLNRDILFYIDKLNRKQNDIDELVEFIKDIKYLTSDQMIYSKSIELIQKHTK